MQEERTGSPGPMRRVEGEQGPEAWGAGEDSVLTQQEWDKDERRAEGSQPPRAEPARVAQPAGGLVPTCQALRVPWPVTHRQVPLRDAEKGRDVIPELARWDVD